MRDHCSPISDTTIMASAGAQCDHVTHVSTQLPYVITAALVSFVTYIIAGFVQSAWIALPVGIGLMIVTLMVIKKKQKSRIKRKQTGDRKNTVSYLCLKEHIVYEIKEIRFFFTS